MNVKHTVHTKHKTHFIKDPILNPAVASRYFGSQIDKNSAANLHSDQKKRVNYSLGVGTNKQFELYSWLKPTKQIGKNQYAAVCEVIDQRTLTKYAIKKKRNIFVNTTDAKRILRELKLMIHLDHPNIINLYGVIPPKVHKRDTFTYFCLIMPRMDTTLKRVIESKQKLTERHIQYFTYQIVRGLQYIHSAGIIHRDLKPENILVNATDCKIKITNFESARGIRDDNIDSSLLTEYVVTRYYRAPEVMCCSRKYDESIDIWSLGCIVGELYIHKPLFKGNNHIQQLQAIFGVIGKPKDLSWVRTDDAKKWISGLNGIKAKHFRYVLPFSTILAQDFVKGLLKINPHKRMKLSKAVNHEWLKEFKRDKDYKKCPVFNISFEFEAAIKTVFGVRHMMYEELDGFYNKCIKREKKCIDMYQKQMELLIMGYVTNFEKHISNVLIPDELKFLILKFALIWY